VCDHISQKSVTNQQTVMKKIITFINLQARGMTTHQKQYFHFNAIFSPWIKQHW